jgi:hypothetical protein
MGDILALLIEISALTDRSDAAWNDDIRVGACKLMHYVLSQNCPLHSFAVHDSRREDCVTICLAMANVAARADGSLELTRTLRAKVHSLTSRCICAALHADSRAALRSAVNPSAAARSLAQQLRL